VIPPAEKPLGSAAGVDKMELLLTSGREASIYLRRPVGRKEEKAITARRGKKPESWYYLKREFRIWVMVIEVGGNRNDSSAIQT